MAKKFNLGETLQNACVFNDHSKAEIRRDSKYLAIETALDAVRLGEPHDPAIDSVLTQKGFAHWIGGELFITESGRNWLAGNR